MKISENGDRCMSLDNLNYITHSKERSEQCYQLKFNIIGEFKGGFQIIVINGYDSLY